MMEALLRVQARRRRRRADLFRARRRAAAATAPERSRRCRSRCASFHIVGDQFTELDALPEALPATGYLWIATTRAAFEAASPSVQAALQRWTGAQLFDLHVSDLLNTQLPSHFDYTSAYDLLVFRRLRRAAATRLIADDDAAAGDGAPSALDRDRHQPGRLRRVRPRAAHRAPDRLPGARRSSRSGLQSAGRGERRGAARSARMPTSPADLMLRMVNHMVDSYLELRRLLTRQLDELQQELFGPRAASTRLARCCSTRATRCTCSRTPARTSAARCSRMARRARRVAGRRPTPQAQRERELLRVRSRDVLEHIERVLRARAPPGVVGRDRGADALLGAEQPHQRHHAHAHRADRDLPAAEPRSPASSA